jgi:two-component system alkaline phosphatase synthesis response regulator PhoP
MKDLKRSILIVEDDESIRTLLQQNFEFEGYAVHAAADGKQGYDQAIKQQPDLIILDLMLPVMSGMDVCQKLRDGGNNVPIIMLTARGENTEKIAGLRTGADDYITKPFDLMELMARVEAIFRRTGKNISLDIVTVGSAEVNFTNNTITKDGKEHQITQVEAQLLKYLIHHEGKILEREKIMSDVWGHEYLLSSRTIDTHVTHLRQKLEDNPSQPRHIVTIHRVGYKFQK